MRTMRINCLIDEWAVGVILKKELMLSAVIMEMEGRMTYLLEKKGKKEQFF
jgi:hypothetical protein